MNSVSGASGDHVSMDIYPNRNEDFAGANLSSLDTWVFDRVEVGLSILPCCQFAVYFY